MNEQVTKERLPANLSAGVEHMLKQTSRSNPLLRFKKGKYFIGGEEIPLGRQYIVYALDWVRGFVKWENGAIVTDRLGRVADGFVLPERSELGDTDEHAWVDGKDPWEFQNMLPLEDVRTGEFVVFVSPSFGGKIAVEKICNRVARDLKAGRDRGSPTIELAVGVIKTTEFGDVPRPDFVIVGWEHDQHKPVFPPTAENDLNDSIPF
jgi:hypothetical protein